jgi:ATP-dependent Clp protease ATP-binding subunit ClpA
VDFKNTVVIMTSNLGSTEFQRGSLGFRHEAQSKTEQQRLKGELESALKRTFRPEFLNRIDEVIIFQPLTGEQIRQIVDLIMKEVQKRLADRKITVTLTDAAKDWLAKTGFDPVYGARPLKRTIQREVENPLSKKILQGEVKEGDEVKVDLSTEGLVFSANSG